jgi:hypothetical protein
MCTGGQALTYVRLVFNLQLSISKSTTTGQKPIGMKENVEKVKSKSRVEEEDVIE